MDPIAILANDLQFEDVLDGAMATWTSPTVRTRGKAIRRQPSSKVDPPSSMALDSHASSLRKITPRKVHACSENGSRRIHKWTRLEGF
jgi:hypothetical protein